MWGQWVGYKSPDSIWFWWLKQGSLNYTTLSSSKLYRRTAKMILRHVILQTVEAVLGNGVYWGGESSSVLNFLILHIALAELHLSCLHSSHGSYNFFSRCSGNLSSGWPSIFPPCFLHIIWRCITIYLSTTLYPLTRKMPITR